MSNKTLILSILSMLISLTTFSQNVDIKGKIISSVNGEGLFEGFIQIEHRFGISTIEYGEFEIKHLELNKKYNLKISSFGYFDLDTTITIKDKLNIDEFKFVLNANCNIGIDKAKEDIKKGEPKLLIFGSIAPSANTKNDIKFEKKYKVNYFDYGCTPPTLECMEAYNKEIVKFLDKKYGKKWRKRVRRDVWALGIE